MKSLANTIEGWHIQSGVRKHMINIVYSTPLHIQYLEYVFIQQRGWALVDVIKRAVYRRVNEKT
jgi:hypothetical protein